MKVAVIGVGRMGRLHAELLADLPGVTELLLADSDEMRAAGLATELRARGLDVEAAIGEADAVVVATPPEWHATQVTAAMAAGRPVLCEKPLGSDLAETLSLARAVEQSNAVVQVGFQRRFDAGFRAAADRMLSGELGELNLMRLAAHDPPYAEAATPDQLRPLDTAPLFRDSSIHDFDVVRWLSGDEVSEVHAEGIGRDRSRPSDAAALATAVVTMRLARGGLAVLDATLLHALGYDVRAELFGSRDAVTVGLARRSPLHHLEPDAPQPEHTWQGYLERFRDAYREELRTFLGVAAGERPSPVTARDGVEAMRIAVAATRSFVERRRVSLDEIPALPRLAEVA